LLFHHSVVTVKHAVRSNITDRRRKQASNVKASHCVCSLSSESSLDVRTTQSHQAELIGHRQRSILLSRRIHHPAYGNSFTSHSHNVVISHIT